MSHPDSGLHWSHSHTGSTSGARFRASPGCRLLGRTQLKSWQRCWRRARPACTRRRAAGPRRRPGGARASPWTRACSACARASRRASGPGCEPLLALPSAARDKKDALQHLPCMLLLCALMWAHALLSHTSCYILPGRFCGRWRICQDTQQSSECTAGQCSWGGQRASPRRQVRA